MTFFFHYSIKCTNISDAKHSYISIKSSLHELQFRYKVSYITKSLPPKKRVSRYFLGPAIKELLKENVKIVVLNLEKSLKLWKAQKSIKKITPKLRRFNCLTIILFYWRSFFISFYKISGNWQYKTIIVNRPLTFGPQNFALKPSLTVDSPSGGIFLLLY